LTKSLRAADGTYGRFFRERNAPGWTGPIPWDEAMRLVRGYMEAFGLNQDELYTVCTRNPARVVGLALH
jgi:hypothetical protein